MQISGIEAITCENFTTHNTMVMHNGKMTKYLQFEVFIYISKLVFK
jgi:hypothetical protein